MPATKKSVKKTAAKKATAKKATPKKADPMKELRKKAKEQGITLNQFKVLQVLKDGKEKTAPVIAEKTGIVKGKKIPELFEAGLIESAVQEGQRAHLHKITAAGQKVLAAIK